MQIENNKQQNTIMTIEERIAALRKIMTREGIDAYIVSGTDPHDDEYLPETWKQRQWISGFTGSFGTIVITQDHAGFWTDTRYFVQYERELGNTEYKLHKLRVPDAVDYPEWLAETMQEGQKLAFDGYCMPTSIIRKLKSLLEPKGVKVVNTVDLLGELWLDRPEMPSAPIMSLDVKYTGSSAAEKLERLRGYMQEKGATYTLLSSLDEIAWLFNLRGGDINFTPVFISYAIVGMGEASIFVKPGKVPAEVAELLAKDNISVKGYHQVTIALDEIDESNIFMIDAGTLNYGIYEKVSSRFKTVECKSPLILWKGIKNPTEIQGFKDACRKDGVALTKFYYWLSKQDVSKLSELDIEKVLGDFRKAQPESMGDGFRYICAYGENAALPHYFATEENYSMLKPEGLLLMDTGGQYLHGTTDITRTVPLGPVSQLQKEDFTLVLKGMIELGRIVFTKGTNGKNLDILARMHMWKYQRNYGHGTGHGVGQFLTVHEGPQDIRLFGDPAEHPMMPGMITSDEPGIYRQGEWGVRHENLNVCLDLGTNEFGEWYCQEPITLCYIEKSCIIPEMLTADEIDWLNAYHKKCYDEITPYLTPEEAEWHKEKTSPIEYTPIQIRN